MDEALLEQGDGGLVGRAHAQAQDLLGLAAPHGQDPVPGRAAHGLRPVEVVAELGALLLLALQDVGAHDAGVDEQPAHGRADAGVLAGDLGRDVPGAGQGGLGVGHVLAGVDEGGGAGGRIVARRPVRGQGRLLQQPQRQGLEAPLAGHGGAGAALGPERQVDILEGRQVGRGPDAGLQRVGQQFALGQRLQDRAAPLVQLVQLLEPVADGGDGHLVQAAGGLLAVAADEGNGAALGDQVGDGLDLAGRDLQLGGDDGGVGRGHGSSGDRYPAGRRGSMLRR